jgi:hypothetical protein
MTERIRWEPTRHSDLDGEDGGWDGKVGTLEPLAFQVWRSNCDFRDVVLGEWVLSIRLPGPLSEQLPHGHDPEALKAEAEKWLERFVSSLGAVFGPGTAEPDCSAVTRFEVIDLTEGLASRSPDSVRAVVAYGISAKLAFQDDGRTLKVFLTDPAKEAGQ